MSGQVDNLGRILLGGCGIKNAELLAAGTGMGFTQSSFHTEGLYREPLSQREACTHKGFDTAQASTQRSLYTQGSFYTQTCDYTEDLYPQKLLYAVAIAHRNVHTGTPLRREALTHRRFYTETFYTNILPQKSF